MYYNNKKLAVSIFWIVLGILLVILTLTGVIDDSVTCGMGAAFIAVGAVQIFQNMKYRKDPEYREKIDIEAGDERNQLIRMKSWAYTGYISVLVASIGSVVAYVMDQKVVQETLLFSVCFVVFVYWVVTLILNKKM